MEDSNNKKTEWQQFNKELEAIQILGERLPEFVLQLSKVEAPPKK